MKRSILTLLALCAASFHTLSADTLHPSNLRCEYLENPLGIDVPQPRLGWVLTSDERGAKQTAYQILVASSGSAMEKGQADLWDSGKVTSAETVQIPYCGKPLTSHQQAVWKVRVWDAKGQVIESKPATWEMGLLKPDAWSAKWIARTTDTNANPAPLLRRAFNLDGKIKQARAYICGLGYHELYLNGGKIGDHILDPGYTRYDRRALYVTHDVTGQLKQGANTIGVFVFDIGQNLAGMAELTVTGPAGTRVQMRYGERLSPDGTLDTRDIEQHVKKIDKKQQHQTDTYILKGSGKETWHSRFTYHGLLLRGYKNRGARRRIVRKPGRRTEIRSAGR